jgi:hypothetical protein
MTERFALAEGVRASHSRTGLYADCRRPAVALEMAGAGPRGCRRGRPVLRRFDQWVPRRVRRQPPSVGFVRRGDADRLDSPRPSSPR